MEEVAHGADEDGVRSSPSERLIEALVMQGDLETIGVFFKPHSLQSARHHLGIAMGTPLRNLGATRYRIPRFVSPFYFGGFC
jgi:hypothetical protein